MGHELHPIIEKALAPFLNMTDNEDKRIKNTCVYGTSHPEIYKENTMEDFDTTSMDAVIWAKEFMRIYNNNHQATPGEWIDENLMIGWFANAIMAGYDNKTQKIQHLLDCEADCIKSGNSLSPKEQKVALDVIANIQQRMYGNEVNPASFHKPEGGNPLDPDSNICETAPFPECNGANGCDTCEHQPAD